MLAKGADKTEFELIEINSEKIEIQKAFDLYDGQYKITKTTVDSLEKAQKTVDDLKQKHQGHGCLTKTGKRNPWAPYTTSTLQQDASRRLGINGKEHEFSSKTV